VQPMQPEAKEPRLSPTQRWLLWIAGTPTVLSIGWPVTDLIYKGTFPTPGIWWVLVLLTLATWITFVVVTGQQRILSEITELRREISDYGDECRSDGAAIAVRLHTNGSGPVRQLKPVE
jgi:hypothetical protein